MATNRLKHRVMMLVMWALLRSILLLSTLPALGQAQITLDGSLGPRGPLPGPNYRIDANAGQIRGSNLFHSFGQFNVRTDESATFVGPNTIANVVGRVTGGEPSLIDGRLRSEIAGANLFLLNPSGVLFGPNASLGVSGSFHVSTADFLRFADGAKFSANLGQESSLTVAPPTAFGFLGNNPAAITVQGSTLKVADGKALSAVGGNITLVGGSLQAPSGRLQLASVASPGEVVFSPLELAPDLQVDGFVRLGRLELSQGTNVTVSSNAGAGTVLIRGGQLLVNNALINANTGGAGEGARLGIDVHVAEDLELANRARMLASSGGAGRAGDLRLIAGSVHLDDSFIGSGPSPAATTGNIDLRAGRVALTGGALIHSSTIGANRGGDVTVVATDALAIAGGDSGLFSTAWSSGDAGRLFVSAPTLTMEGGSIQAAASDRGSVGEISVNAGRVALTGDATIGSLAIGSGRGGNITVAAQESVSISGSNIASFAAGDPGRISLSAPTMTIDGGLVGAPSLRLGRRAGDISVEAGHLTLSGGGIITGSTQTEQKGGDITIKGSESISISGVSGILSATSGQGNAGRISISTPLLTMDEGLIRAGATDGSRGNAGDIEMRVGRLTLTGGAQIDTSSRGVGRGGDVTVVATDTMAIAGRDREGNPSGLFSRAEASGDAGNLLLEAGTIRLTDGANISTSTRRSGRGGNLFISTRTLHMDDGLIAANTGRDSSGAAGNMLLELGSLTLTGGAQIESSTAGMGRGGDVTVTATDAITIAGRDREGIRSGMFSNTSSRGDAGRLFISAPLLLMDGGSIAANTLGDGNGDDIEVRAGRLTLTGGAQIFSGIGAFVDGVVGTEGPGRGGNATVIATDSILLAGRDEEGFRSSIGSNALIGSGDAGKVFIATPSLDMRDGFISTGTSSRSRGNAGDLRVEVRRLTLTDGARIISSTEGSVQGGAVEVAAIDSIFIAGRSPDGNWSGMFSESGGLGQGGSIQISGRQIELSSDGIISARSTGAGAAGTIQIQADETFRSAGGRVIAESASAGGGAVALTAGRLVQLMDSELTTSVRGGDENAGNITIDTIDPQFVILENSKIRADAFGGMGGNIRIDAGVFLADPASLVSASSALGIQGTVDIRAPVTSLSGALAPLPQAFVSAAALLPARCAARLSGGTYSSLVLGGRDGLPLDPGGVLPSPLTLDKSVGGPAVDGTPHQQKIPAKFALLAVADTVFPRLHGGNVAWVCSK